MSEKIEFTSRGKRQLKSVIHAEIKEQVDELIEPMIQKILVNRINAKIEFLSVSRIEEYVKKQIKDIWWHVVNEMLRKANFQDKLQDEIIKYLHKKWACGSIPFDDQFNNALMKVVKKLIGG